MADISTPSPEIEEQCMTLLKQWHTGDMPFSEVYSQLQHFDETVRKSGRLVDEGRVQHFIGYLQHQRGRVVESIRHYERAIECFQETGNQRLLLMCETNQAENYRKQGRYQQALKLYRTISADSQKAGNLVIQTTTMVNQGLVYLNLENFAMAEKAFLKGQAQAEQWTEMQHLLPALQSETAYGLARCYLAAGQIDRAWKTGQSALELAVKSGQNLPIGLANRVLGEILTQKADSEESAVEAYLSTAEQAFNTIKADDEIAYVMLVQARYYVKCKQLNKARVKYKAAMRHFTRLGMIDSASQVAREMTPFQTAPLQL